MTARPRQSGILAICVALVFVVQSLGSAYAIGIGGRPPALDAFGNPLCITSGEHGAPADGKHGGVGGCCTLACASMAPSLGLPEATAATGRVGLKFVAKLAGPVGHVAAEVRSAAPVNPRAPPSTM